MKNNKKLLCFGFGFTARQLAGLLPDWTLYGTMRRSDSDPDGPAGVMPLPYESPDDITEISKIIKTVSHLLISIPPGKDSDPVLADFSAVIAGANNLQWIGYLSTTGVYGDKGGAWIDETAPYNPSGMRGARRAAAEQGWRRLFEQQGCPVHIFRLAGIYGPGRNQLVSLRAGTARRIIKPGQVFSRIHVDDIANILKKSMEKPYPGRIYNMCDDEAAPPQDVVAYAAELLDMPAPEAVPYETADLSDMARSFYDDNKRLHNDRIKKDLNYQLKYPTYREGLAALLKDL